MLAQTGDLPFAFEAREHTAQVDQSPGLARGPLPVRKDGRRTDAENRDEMRQEGEPTSFLPALFCSPTMELGVDISALNAVFLRNAPPTPATLRAAGGTSRSKRSSALVITYCAAQSPHDQYYFPISTRSGRGGGQAPRIRSCQSRPPKEPPPCGMACGRGRTAQALDSGKSEYDKSGDAGLRRNRRPHF